MSNVFAGRRSDADISALYFSADPCGLDDAQSLVLLDYTKRFSLALNTSLREGGRVARSHVSMIELLKSALSHLRLYTGVVLRSVRLNDKKTEPYAEHAIVTWPAFTSTTAMKPFPGNVQFRIRVLDGRFVSPLSSTPLEDEIMLLPGSRFEVLEHKVDPDGTHQIHLQQVGPFA